MGVTGSWLTLPQTAAGRTSGSQRLTFMARSRAEKLLAVVIAAALLRS